MDGGLVGGAEVILVEIDRAARGRAIRMEWILPYYAGRHDHLRQHFASLIQGDGAAPVGGVARPAEVVGRGVDRLVGTGAEWKG